MQVSLCASICNPKDVFSYKQSFVLLLDCLFFPAAALLGQEIFVTGGQAEKEVINVAEVYSPELNQWEHLVARMESPRVGLSLVSMGNIIYAIGMQTYIIPIDVVCTLAISLML